MLWFLKNHIWEFILIWFSSSERSSVCEHEFNRLHQESQPRSFMIKQRGIPHGFSPRLEINLTTMEIQVRAQVFEGSSESKSNLFIKTTKPRVLAERRLPCDFKEHELHTAGGIQLLQREALCSTLSLHLCPAASWISLWIYLPVCDESFWRTGWRGRALVCGTWTTNYKLLQTQASIVKDRSAQTDH